MSTNETLLPGDSDTSHQLAVYFYLFTVTHLPSINVAADWGIQNTCLCLWLVGLFL